MVVVSVVVIAVVFMGPCDYFCSCIVVLLVFLLCTPTTVTTVIIKSPKPSGLVLEPPL